MEIKYTIEILTKDIQDIEKLVGNLRNSKEASAIELDLALSKLRNVYEILTMIKADRLHEIVSDKPAPELTDTNSGSSVILDLEPEAIPKQEPEPEPEPEPKSEPEPEPESEVKPEPASNAESPGSSILAEKFSAESSINENMAEKLGNDVDTKLHGQPIDNISRNIGINDRFFIIRELFEGEADRFISMVTALDSAENYQAASSILKAQFEGNMDHEGVEILSGLLKRRYPR
jgi:hypothetical protein